MQFNCKYKINYKQHPRIGCDVRVVKEFDSKSNGLCPHRFESCSQRNFFFYKFVTIEIFIVYKFILSNFNNSFCLKVGKICIFDH